MSTSVPAAPGGYTPSLLSRLISGFSGPVGLAAKVVLLAISNAVAIWAGVILANDGKWIALGVLVAATVGIDLVYAFAGRAIPAKFLVPGTIFLIAFQVIPIFYTVSVAFQNYSTGHIGTRDEAIASIRENSLAPSEGGSSYTMTPGRDPSGNLQLLLVDEATGETFIGTRQGLRPQPKGAMTVDAGKVVGPPAGYALVPPDEIFSLDQELKDFRVPTGSGGAISPQGFDVAVDLSPTVRYVEARDVFVRISDGAVFSDDGNGSFRAANGDELEPGWRTGVGFANFKQIYNNPLVRDPFLRVFVWTFAFASLTVFFSFFIGLLLAISLDKPGLHGQRFYRSLLVLPYAIPGFLSLLVWAGLLNDDFGVINKVFHTNIPWLFDANWAKVSVLIVSTWLTFPYFFLVSMGALQSIPGELTEAARVDGGGRFAIFRRVTMPLLLIAVAPLLIASFAFNFNNFNNVFLLTGGGPPAEDQSIAGGTDILISYTYKLAFQAGKGQDYGLASAISIVIFFIVATISFISFKRTSSLENLR